jgi:iron(III) transport system substrate-binding protein
MKTIDITRRGILKGGTALAAGAAVGTVFAEPLRAQAPAAASITPQLIEAARKEGRATWYTSVDLPLAERIARTFEKRYPGVAVRVERSGAERVFTRIRQEYGSNIRNVDLVNSSDAAHLIVWKREGLLEAYVPEDVAKHLSAEHRDPDGTFATFRITLSPLAYNPKLVPAGEVPKSFKELLDPKWAGKMVKAHPSYSGTILTSTFQVSRDLGWDYFEKLAGQKIMQVQSATEPPRKVATGERAIMVDGVEYLVFQLKEKGSPIDLIYPAEGTPLIVGPNAIFKAAPNPNAAKLLQSWMFTTECQQLVVDFGGMRSAHAQVKEKEGRTPLSKIKLMKDDAVAVEKESDAIKKRYTQYFKV